MPNSETYLVIQSILIRAMLRVALLALVLFSMNIDISIGKKTREKIEKNWDFTTIK